MQATGSLQLFLLTSAVPLLLWSSVMGERRRATAALRASEVRYREMVESQTELVCRYLPDSTLTFVNEAYCRYFGRTREDLVGRSFLELIPEAGREAALAHVRALALHPEAKLLEHEVVRPDGTRGWNEWVDRAIFDRDGWGVPNVWTDTPQQFDCDPGRPPAGANSTACRPRYACRPM